MKKGTSLWLIALIIVAVSISGCDQLERSFLARESLSQQVLAIETIPMLEIIPVVSTFEIPGAIPTTNEVGSISTSSTITVQPATLEPETLISSLPGFEDKRQDVIALVGSKGKRNQSAREIVWHWTVTSPNGADGVGIVQAKGEPCYHFCILAQNATSVFARFQYLVDAEDIAWHASTHNDYAIGIAYIGDASVPPTPQQEATRRLLTLVLLENLGLTPESVKVHREIGATDDIAGVRQMSMGTPNLESLWLDGISWERRKLASIQRGMHPELWATKDAQGKWIIPQLTDRALSIQEASAVARLVAENWNIPADEVFLPLVSSESDFRQWYIDGSVVMDVTGDGGTGIGQIVSRWHPEVDMEKARTDAAYNLNEAARILATEFPGNTWEEKVLQYKGNREDFLEIFRQRRISPPTEAETGLAEWKPQEEKEPSQEGWKVKLPIPQVFEKGPSNRKIIALTFDGGWADRQGEDTLKALRELGVRATLFLTGQYLQAGPDMVREMLRDGHEIGNHSFSHPDFSTISVNEIKEELEKTAQTFEQLTGKSIGVWFRFPSGASSATAIQTVCQNGYQAVGWDTASRDWEEIPAEQIYNDVVNNAHPESIVVLHLGGKNTASALKLIIPELRNRGYKLVTLTEMYQK